ncbi:hypothetical protein GCM10009760_47030 [Kitasatospora kazusensis]|uniref:Uncharacterized protein n=1 Tax=Kitasatospora kazusensis TaxID=407974 RepID=A0ABP5LPU3_9ACTN
MRRAPQGRGELREPGLTANHWGRGELRESEDALRSPENRPQVAPPQGRGELRNSEGALRSPANRPQVAAPQGRGELRDSEGPQGSAGVAARRAPRSRPQRRCTGPSVRSHNSVTSRFARFPAPLKNPPVNSTKEPRP